VRLNFAFEPAEAPAPKASDAASEDEYGDMTAVLEVATVEATPPARVRPPPSFPANRGNARLLRQGMEDPGEDNSNRFVGRMVNGQAQYTTPTQPFVTPPHTPRTGGVPGAHQSLAGTPLPPFYTPRSLATPSTHVTSPCVHTRSWASTPLENHERVRNALREEFERECRRAEARFKQFLWRFGISQ